jgi:GTP-binding protein Era
LADTNDRIPNFKSGFVAIAGAPNVGKSTLLNRMLGEKISITSKKPQTTRNRILGILHRPRSQIVFIDTPGIHRASGPLNVSIVDTAILSLGDADLILVMTDASHADPRSEQILLKNLVKLKKKTLLALNKIDLVKKQVVLSLIETWSKEHTFEAVVPISAKHGSQVEELIQVMEAHLLPGPPFFPEDSLTDLPESFIAAEMIREKVFRLTGQEIPYATAVTVDSFDENDDRSLIKIHASIHVERESQKGILIGKGGCKLKEIGKEARKEIEWMVGAKVFLKLFVRVQKNWSKNTKALRRLGY